MNAILKETENRITSTYNIVYKNSDIDIDTNVQHICRIMADENGEDDGSKMSKSRMSGGITTKPQLSKKASQMIIPRTPLSLFKLDEL